MTIDESIAHAREVAEKVRKSINSAVTIQGEKTCIACAEEHEQLAEWLEELKAYRENSNGYNKEDIELNRNAMYNKAIDDFAQKLHAKCDGMINNKWNSNVAPVSWAEAYADFKDDIDEITEQLKGGGENE